jgi:hypothetical protein
MNFLDFFRKIKVKNIGKVCIIKSGIFYYALEKDALVMAKYCNLEKICFSVNICKVGFPINSLDKYMNMLKLRNISFCVYDVLEGIHENCKLLDEETIKYKDKEYGKIYETYFGDVDYTDFIKDCFNCKFYEREIICNVSRLTDTVNKYLEEIEKFNRYQYEKKNSSDSLAGKVDER